MKDIKNWKEVIKNIYVFEVAKDVWYEIHINKWVLDDDISDAVASLYFIGDWQENGEHFFKRECLLTDNTFKQCMDAAINDDAIKNQHLTLREYDNPYVVID